MVIDRKNVIKEAEETLSCVLPDEKDTSGIMVRVGWIRDVIAMLKEQGAKTGHWIDTTKVIGFPRVQCSVCGSGQGAIWMNYCPNCGAKMEGGDV